MASLSAVLAIVAGFAYLQDGSTEADGNAANSSAGHGSVAASDQADFEGSPLDSQFESNLEGEGFGSFAASSGNDGSVHKVVLRATSDGPIGLIGYVLRDGEKRKVSPEKPSWSIGRNVRGPRPVAQIAVQVSTAATYARCTIFVDGKQVSTFVARGPNSVVVCTG